MRESEKYAPSIRFTILRWLVCGLLLSCCFALTASLVVIHLPETPAQILYRILRWPSGAVPGMLLGAALTLLRKTTVELTENRILVSSPLRQRSFALSQFADSSITRKTHILSFGKFVTVKCCLIFKTSNGIKKCPLNGFGEKELEAVLAAVRKRQTIQLSAEEKIEVSEQYRENLWQSLSSENNTGHKFCLPATLLLPRERKWLQKISFILICVMLVIGGLDVLEIRASHTPDVQLVFLTILASVIPVLLSVMWISLHVRGRLCAGDISVGEDHLMVGGKYYSWSGLSHIRMTSPRKKSSSAFPVQRYMYLTTSGGTDKYWLGSEVSFGRYSVLCSHLEKALVFFPDKLKYI